MTKLNETKIEDILLMYRYFKRVNQQYRGKVFKNAINSLAKAFNLSISTKDGKKKCSKDKKKCTDRIDNFDREAIRLVVHDLYRENVLPTAENNH